MRNSKGKPQQNNYRVPEEKRSPKSYQHNNPQDVNAQIQLRFSVEDIQPTTAATYHTVQGGADGVG